MAGGGVSTVAVPDAVAGVSAVAGAGVSRLAPRSVLVGLTGYGAARAGFNALAAIAATALLGPHDRGLAVLGTTLASAVALLAGLGTGPALRSRLPVAEGPEHRRRLVASYTWWSLVSGVAAGGLAVLLSAVSAPLIAAGMAEPWFLVGVFVTALGQVAMIQLPDAWYAAGLFGPGSAWAAGVAAGGLVGVLGGALLGRSAWLLLLTQGLAMVLVATAQAARLRAAGLLSLRPPGRRELLDLPRLGIRALGLSLGLVVALRADRYVLGAVAGPAAVGVYSLAATLSGIPGLIPSALGQIIHREVAAGHGTARVRQVSWRAVRLTALAGLAVAAAGWVLIVPLFGAGFAGARPVLLVLLAAELAFAPFAVASRGLLGGGWMGTAGLLGVAGSAVAVLCYLVAVPAGGLYGAASACLVVYGGLSLAAGLLLRRRLRTRAAVAGPPASRRWRPWSRNAADRAALPSPTDRPVVG